MSDRLLPNEAYEAMQALKDQSSASFGGIAESGKPIVDKPSLKDAQARMSEFQPWTNAIVRMLVKGNEATVETIDATWLENQFS